MSNFHETAEIESIRLHDGRILRCLLRREDGELEEAELDLNCCIGNIDGAKTLPSIAIRVCTAMLTS